jgi:glucokinase
MCAQEGTKKPNGVVAMLGAGTGLGECFLTCSSHAPGLYDCFPSEGGHSEFAPRTDLEIELLQVRGKATCPPDAVKHAICL